MRTCAARTWQIGFAMTPGFVVTQICNDFHRCKSMKKITTYGTAFPYNYTCELISNRGIGSITSAFGQPQFVQRHLRTPVCLQKNTFTHTTEHR